MGKRRAAYLKCTTRSADDWPAVGVAVLIDGDGRAHRAQRRHRQAHAAGAAESSSREERRSKALKRRRSGRRGSEIEGDLHGSAAYKKQLVRVYLQRSAPMKRASASH